MNRKAAIKANITRKPLIGSPPLGTPRDIGSWEAKAPQGSPRHQQELRNRMRELRQSKKHREERRYPAGSGQKLV